MQFWSSDWLSHNSIFNNYSTRARWIWDDITKSRWISPTRTNRKRQGTSTIHMSHVYQNCQRANGLAWTAWMKNQNIVAMNISFLKTHRDSRILHSKTAKKNWQITFKQALVGFLFVCLFFFRWNCIFYSILSNELKRFVSGAILSFAKKKSHQASNFKPTSTPTIGGEHGIMAHIP